MMLMLCVCSRAREHTKALAHTHANAQRNTRDGLEAGQSGDGGVTSGAPE